MPSTINTGLETPVTGTEVNTWGIVLNANTTIIDACYGSVTSKSLTNANVTLTTTESQVSILRFSGTLTGNVLITLGAIIKSWIVENTCLGAFTVRIQGSTATGNIVGLPPGSCQVYWDGTNMSFINLGIIGKWEDWAVASMPAWVTACTVPPYLQADGTTFSAVTYPILNQILGTTTLPNQLGRLRATLNGGTNRITSAVCSIDGDTRFSAGGQQALAINQVNLPIVSFSGSKQVSSFSTASGDGTVLVGRASGDGGASTSITVSSGGSGTSFVTMPPTVIGGIAVIRAA